MKVENIFTIAERCLQRTDISEKLALTHQASFLLKNQQLSFQSNHDVLSINHTSFPAKPELLPPRDMPRRRLNSEDGKAAFFHALAHIEFIAIYLAWDIIYRFRGLPDKFYQDWLCVADEETQHFALLREHLQATGVDYGDLPAHPGLWGHAEDTADDILARLAIVPRCMEARGLDVTPAMIEKFKAMDDRKSVSILSRILEDEIGHVAVGSYWFKFLCEQRSVNPEKKYQELIMKYYKGKPKGPFNREMRIIAGFSNDEIDWLENRSHE
jgi:uncharacterized ferritin-like protein (DUF455 family)